MASLYDFSFEASQDLDGVEGAGGIELFCQVCKQIDPDTVPILVQAGNASVIREAARNHVHTALGHTHAFGSGLGPAAPANLVTGLVSGSILQATEIHGDVRL